ncbi:arginine--tRNA ligase [Salsuginibacillus kocurii]|uniref:arginine--tRNA ligase n=1 Tax=Salsuginibacillus kocurii TaxID=427078 RepID=UPI000360BB22|nr:arginine--tRNA ligase [Salsuginibacillus kocurii]
MTIVEQVKETLKQEIVAAVERAGLATREEMPAVLLETPKEKAHGDFATNMAMQLARVAKKNPRQIAEELTAELDTKKASVEHIEIAGPGFINFFLNNRYLLELIPAVLTEKQAYGRTNSGEGQRVQVEFVSANPTGDLHLGHARGAAVGDSLCNILDMAGYNVEREYYINDAGGQIHNLALSVEARYLQALGQEAALPEDGYQGEDVKVIGEELAAEHGERYAGVAEEERLAIFRELGLKHELDKLKEDLTQYRVEFDNWFSETSLYESGKIEETLLKLKEDGHVYEEDGAVWFRSTAFGDDKDRVLVKQDGAYTYLAPDIAYHLNKFERGFDKLVNIWGADHHGYIPRMQAAIQALGFEKSQLDVEIVQMVSLLRSGEKVKMSKRTGNAVTLRDLMEEVGLDATRYFFAMRSADTHMDFDMDLAVSESNENPVYYVQYAHARLCSIFRQAEEKGMAFKEEASIETLGSEKEIDVLKKVGQFPEIIDLAADQYAPHRLANYLHELAAVFHSFYNAERMVDPDAPELTQARLKLAKAVQITLQNGMNAIGVHAPERM